MRERFDNPFAAVKAEELDDDTIAQWFEWPGAFGNTSYHRHELLVGGRGSGKTIFLKFLSHRVQRLANLNLPVAVYCDLRTLQDEFVDPAPLGQTHWRDFVAYVSLFLIREASAVFQQCVEDGLLDSPGNDFASGEWEPLRECGLSFESYASLAESSDRLMSSVRRTIRQGAFDDLVGIPADFRVLNQICSVATRRLTDPSLPKTVFLLLDQYDDLSTEQQRASNLLFRNPTPRGYHLKVGVRPPGLRTRDTLVGGQLRTDNDYYAVQLEFQDGKTEPYHALLRAVSTKRLRFWKTKTGIGDASEDVTHYLGDWFDTFVETSSGIVHQFMLLCEEAFGAAFQTNAGLQSATSIPAAVCSGAIDTVSKRQTRDLLGSVVGQPNRARSLVNHLASAARTAESKLGPLDGGIAFRIDGAERLDLENAETIRLCYAESLLQSPPSAMQGCDHDLECFRLNRMLWAAKDLNASHFGVYGLEGGDLNERMRPFVPKPKAQVSGQLFPMDLGEIERDLRVETRQPMDSWLQRSNRILGDMRAHHKSLMDNMGWSISILERLEKECLAWVRSGLIRPELATRFTVVFGGSFGRLEAAQHVSDGDFFVLSDPNAEVVESANIYFRKICEWLRHQEVKVEDHGPLPQNPSLAAFEERGFPKIVSTEFPTEKWGKQGELAEAQTLRLVMLTEGTAVYNPGLFERQLKDLRAGYRFDELARTNSLQKVFLKEFASWCGGMWNRIYIRDKTGELAWIKVELHREFLKRSTALALLAHVADGEDSSYATQHEVLTSPPLLRLLAITDLPGLKSDTQTSACIRNIVSDYNDAQKAVCDGELRTYWDNPAQQLQLEQAHNASLTRITEQVRQINHQMLRHFDQLKEILIARATERDVSDFGSTIGW